MLYVPKGRAREYAPLAVNHYKGCSHRCSYCYVPTIPPYKFSKTARADFHANPHPRKNVIRQLERDCRKRPGRGERVLLSFTTDPYQPLDTEFRLTRQVIQTLHLHGYAVQVLTKGGSRALGDLDIFTPQDAFATTVTCLDNQASRVWEPGAALPADRIDTLIAFHNAGIPTWISLEPVLDPDIALEIIRQTQEYVDLFKIGKLNYHPLAASIDWRTFGLAAADLCESFNVQYYLKKDLVTYFPAGWASGPCQTTVAELEQHSVVQSRRPHSVVPIVHRQPSLFPNP